MTPRTKKTAVALSGALVLASGAYALGSQTGDGTALAGGNPTSSPRSAGPHGPGPRDLSGIAAQLGVTEAKLRAALEDLRPDRRAAKDEHRAELAKPLAAELGLDEAKVTAALEKFRGDRKVVRRERRGDRLQRFDEALAAKLGVDAAKVRSAFDALKPGPNRRADKPALADLAKQIGVSEAKLRAALDDLRPGGKRPRPAAAAAPAPRPTSPPSRRSSASPRPSCAPRCRRSAARPSSSTRPSATRSSPSWPPSSASPRPRSRTSSAASLIMGGVVRSEPLVLVVDDEATVRQALERALRLEGFAVTTAADGLEALAAVAQHPPAVIVLDVMMPGLDGVSVVRRLRGDGIDVPVCMLSARDEVEDRVAGLQAGADDYLVKPFAIAELTARLEALLRRRGTEGAGPHMAGDVVVDPRRHVATRAGRELGLTRREFELLDVFVRHPGQVLSRDQLLSLVWGYTTDVETNVVDVFVGYLRRKLESAGEPRILHTVRGVGWALRP